MLLNANIALAGNDVILVPYEARHVPRYHEWMSDAELREATASEALSLEEEYDMQKSWREDADKLTFISLLKRAHDNREGNADFVRQHGVDDMIGDINVFLSEEADDDDDDQEGGQTHKVAEISLMIAEKRARRRGLATSVLKTFLPWTSKALDVPPRRFFVRIGMDNEHSIRLFEKLGFVKAKESSVFREVELRWPSDAWTWDNKSTVIRLD